MTMTPPAGAGWATALGTAGRFAHAAHTAAASSSVATTRTENCAPGAVFKKRRQYSRVPTASEPEAPAGAGEVRLLAEETGLAAGVVM